MLGPPGTIAQQQMAISASLIRHCSSSDVWSWATFKVLLCLCSSLQSPSSLLRASTARLCSPCSWSFSFITWRSFFWRTFICFWSLRCSSSCKSTHTVPHSSDYIFSLETNHSFDESYYIFSFFALFTFVLSTHQLGMLLDDGLQFLFRRIEFVQTLHQQHSFLPWAAIQNLTLKINHCHKASFKQTDTEIIVGWFSGTSRTLLVHLVKNHLGSWMTQTIKGIWKYYFTSLSVADGCIYTHYGSAITHQSLSVQPGLLLTSLNQTHLR